MLDPKLARVQRNAWSCGPHALRHALLCRDKRVSWRRLARLARITPAFDGDTEPGLMRAAAALGLRLGHEVRLSHRRAKKSIRRQLSKGMPVLMCVDRDRHGPWQHWITITAADIHGVSIADSARPGPPVQQLAWRDFLGRACCYHPGETRFDLYPLGRA